MTKFTSHPLLLVTSAFIVILVLSEMVVASTSRKNKIKHIKRRQQQDPTRTASDLLKEEWHTLRTKKSKGSSKSKGKSCDEDSKGSKTSKKSKKSKKAAESSALEKSFELPDGTIIVIGNKKGKGKCESSEDLAAIEIPTADIEAIKGNRKKGKIPTSSPTISTHPTYEPTVNLYPYCIVPHREYIGDGWCHGPPYDVAVCGYDGGDCPIKYPNCTATITPFFGDGHCDMNEPFNVAECGFDDGDCEPDCSGAGNGVCEIEFNTTTCDHDGGDCLIYQWTNSTGNSTGNSTNATTYSFDQARRRLFEVLLDYFHPRPEEDILEWQK